ncbi:MAG: 30S ribosomal protein S4e [Candidatus Aenigmatarchaeota archaeon]
MRMKRYTMPKFWRLEKKGFYWAAVPKPGPHPKAACMPLSMIVRDVLGYAETGQEAKKIITQGKVLVDKQVRKEPAFPVGLMDVLEIPDAGKAFRVLMNERGPVLKPIKPEQAGMKLCRIEGKMNIKKGLFQLNLHDGRSMLAKDGKPYKPLDSVLLELPGQKMLKHFRYETGAPALVIAGRNKGITGKIKKVRRRSNMLEKSTVVIQSKDKEIQTLLEYVMVGEVPEKPGKPKAEPAKPRPKKAPKKPGPKKAKGGKK